MKSSVLIIDDHPTYQQRLMSAAQARGFQVLPAVSTAQEAVEAVSHHMPDVVLLDLHLGDDLSGLDLCRLLADLIGGARIVVSSSFTDPELMESAFAAGATRCIRKPFRMDEALRLFENIARSTQEAAR
jgi:DNA-binding NarL/FixJ family response regulator